MTWLEFTLATLLLLATPGPTNTLISLAGYLRGWARAMPLISAEIAGYLTTIVPLVTLAAPYLDAHPSVANAIKLAAGAWVLYLAIKLWRRADTSGATNTVSWRRVYVTTVLNPKALIVSLVIMPTGTLATVAPWLALYVLYILIVASCWIVAGSLMKGRNAEGQHALIARRIAAVFLVGFSTILAGSAVAAMM
jgi:threonine/homoserine/homoserine lactone efflux protein